MMPESIKVLHVEDDFADAMLLQHALQDAGAHNMDMEVVRMLVDAKYKLMARSYDLIIADLRLPDSRDPVETIGMIEKHSGSTPIVVLTGSATVDQESIGDGVKVLDKNHYFHNRDEKKTQLLHEHIMGALETGDDTILL